MGLPYLQTKQQMNQTHLSNNQSLIPSGSTNRTKIIRFRSNKLNISIHIELTKFTMTVMNLGSEFFAAASYEFDD